MELKEIIERVKEEYSGNAELDGLVSDLENKSSLRYWGETLCGEEFNSNKELAKELFILEVENCSGVWDYLLLAEAIGSDKYLADKKSSEDIFKKAIELADRGDDKIDLANAIIKTIDDKDLARNLYEKALEDDISFVVYDKLIQSIENYLDDKEWSEAVKEKLKEVFAQKIKELEYTYEFLEACEVLHNNYNYKESEYAKNLIDFCLEKAVEVAGNGHADYCSIYEFYRDTLAIEELADKFKDEYYSELEKDFREYGKCEEVFDGNIDISSDTQGYYKIEIEATGGEYGFGIIENSEKIALLREKIENGDLALNNSNDTTEVNFYECDKQILHSYGPDVRYAKVTIEVYEDEDCEDEIETIISYKKIDEVGLNIFTLSNPYLKDSDKEKYSKDSLQFGGFYTEKRIHFPAIVHIEEGETFNIDNVYVGVVNMDETLSSDEIVSKVYYITPQKANEIMSIYDDGDYEDEPLSDYISDIFYDISSGKYLEIKDILKACECEVLDIEGKGESEEIFAIVSTIDGDILFEDNVEYSS